jgi:hypothetical protein
MFSLHTQALLASGLSTVLLVLSFAFSVVALTSSTWVTNTVYSGDTIDNRTKQGWPRRGPFYATIIENNFAAGTYTAASGSGTCFGIDESYLCQQLHVGARLLVASCVFAGVGMLLLLGLSVTVGASVHGRRRHRRHEHHGHGPGEQRRAAAAVQLHRIWALEARTWMRALLDMVLALGITCGALGMLVNEQRPDGDFISSVGDTVQMDHWMLSDGVVFGFLGWLPSVVATAIVPAVFTLGEARLGLGGERKPGRREEVEEVTGTNRAQ